MRILAQASADDGDIGSATLAKTERYAMLERQKDARKHSKRALDHLPRGATPWRRTRDDLSKPTAAKAQRKR